MEKDAAECEPALMSGPGKMRKRQSKRKIVQDENNTVENDCSAEDIVGEDTLTKHAVDSVTELSPLLNSDLSQSQQKKKIEERKSQDIGVEDRISQDNAVTSVNDTCMYSSDLTTSKNAEKGEANSKGEMKSRSNRKKSKEIPENGDKRLECSAGETSTDDCAIEEVICVEPSNLVRVGGLENSRTMNTSSSDFHTSTNLKTQKSGKVKKKRVNYVGCLEPLGTDEIPLQFSTQCLSLEPEAPVFGTSKVACETESEKEEHGRMLQEVVKNNVQDGCIIQSLVGPDDENMEMEPICEAARLESTSGETSLCQKGSRKKKKRGKIVESDSGVPEHPGESCTSCQSENEAPISCVTTSVSMVKTEKEDHGKMIKEALKVDLQDDYKIHSLVFPELDDVEIKLVSEAAGLGSTSGETILSQKGKRRTKGHKIVGSDNTVPEPPGEHITSKNPSEGLSLEHDTTVACVGVSISVKKNMKNEQLMEDKKVVESDIHLDSEFQSDVLPKAGNSGSKVVGLESTRHIESGFSNPEDRSVFSKIESITCSEEKTLRCDHSVVHKNSIGVQIDSKTKEPCSSKVEKEDLHLLIVPKDTPSHLPLEKPISSHPKKKLLVLDINGLLADIVSCPDERYEFDIKISGKPVFERPFCQEFLQFCFERFNVGVWSSRLMKNVQVAISYLMGKLKFKLLFCWDQRHCTLTRFKTMENSDRPIVLKELKKLWEKLELGLPWEKGEYDESNTLLVDDSPYKALRNPKNSAIFPYPYKYTDTNDTSLGPSGDIRLYLEGLALAKNVQDYVALNPFGQPAISESNPCWNLYSQIVEDPV